MGSPREPEDIKNPVSQIIRIFSKIIKEEFTIQKCTTSEQYVQLHTLAPISASMQPDCDILRRY